MMGYTHAVTSAAGAVAMASAYGDDTPELYLVSTIAGALGGVAIDIDCKDHLDNPRVTDAGRSRLAVLGLLVLGVILDCAFRFGALQVIISRQYLSLGGLIACLLLLIIGRKSEHRTITHSLLFSAMVSVCVYYVYPEAEVYFFVGCLIHLLLDMFNYPVHNHGVWLLYPKKGKGIAFKICKSARIGNKIIYFIGLTGFIVISIYYIFQMNDNNLAVAPSLLMLYIVITMHFVRRKSEREQRHIMHIKGEL